MPKIAEVFELNGTLCVRLEGWPADEEGSISIYTEKEVEELKRSVAIAISDEALRLFPKPSR